MTLAQHKRILLVDDDPAGTESYLVKPASIADLIDELQSCVNLLRPRTGTLAP